ncbi:AMP-binding protein [Micromonospora sp. WMMD980]|uniref:(2,3-dihydroxybenzoyl)adenylate synthase n=1 Tax=Micromonospora sp. WMMD980 TaxID=3016088 RepID=UPI0024162E78|nr:AMP-binding protein [Micromonospora sp. WMMD980]MDG4799978.1 AMP-binding protein [Micromonospora sp. WMMD980]
MTQLHRPEWTGWSETDAERYRSAGYWTGAPFGDLLHEWATRHAGRTALVDGERRWTYRQLDDAVDRVSAGLRRLGLRRGDRVVVQLPNRAEFVEVWFALQRLGAVPVHAMPGHRYAEIAHLAALSGAAGYVIADRHLGFDYRALAARIRAERRDLDEPLEHVVVVGDPGDSGFTAYRDLTGAVPAVGSDDGPAAGDLALLLLSGGTTGLPKLIPRTHDDYAYNARAGAQVCGLTPEDVYLAILPIAFNFTFACPGVLGTLMSGGTVVIAPNPSPATAFRLIARERVTFTSINPPLVPHWFAEHADSGADLSSLRFVQVGSARLADDLARRFTPTLQVAVQQVYGMAEGLINYTRLDDPADLICTTQGRPCSPADEVRVVDPIDGSPVDEGDVGELLTRGPYTLRGYYRADAAAEASFTPDGFYRTGDLVRRLPSGHLNVVGRVKDQINRGGEKIAATEVEGHLLAHPLVRQAALVGVPDAQWGEAPVAVLVCPDDRPSLADLTGFLRGRGLAAYKLPDRIRFETAMPLTAVGKIDKKALATRITSGPDA